MLDWLLAPIDAARVHDISVGLSWHARLMVLAWGILSPTAILVARFGKILPGQDWPNELDSRVWWKSHWISQSVVLLITVFAIFLILNDPHRGNHNSHGANAHRVLGYIILAFAVFQGLSGVFRGTKGGPTAPAKDGSWRGDHYDMTPWRLAFERVHKTIGYGILALVVYAISAGLWVANAPVWMFVLIIGWWGFLLLAFCILQSKGYAIETYQAIWGPDKNHPGNQKPPRGLGVRRPSDTMKNLQGD